MSETKKKPPAITIRFYDKATVNKLKRQARKNGRSLNAEIVMSLKEAVAG